MTKVTHKDWSSWYLDLVQKAELADYSPVKGCVVFRPRGYAIWERIQNLLGVKIQAIGHQNVYFPLLIPYSFFQKEAQHVEGFSPELGLVTHIGDEKLEDPLVLRPTSETVIWYTLKSWVHSYRDLPLKLNQWANVIRFEKKPRPFLRTTEFLWQEGHTLHTTHQEALGHALTMLDMYKNFLEQDLAIPVYAGVKTEKEKFAGAKDTYSIEALLQDKKALQAGTSHDLHQNFSKAFEVMFQNKEGQEEYPFATSWGVSTRLIGALIMVHADKKGLILPPRIAPFPVVIVPIFKEASQTIVQELVARIRGTLNSLVRVFTDSRYHQSPGWRFNQTELEGFPIRLDIGPKDATNGTVSIFRRDLQTKESFSLKEKTLKDFVEHIRQLLDSIQNTLYQRALKLREGSTFTPQSFQELQEIYARHDNGGFSLVQWCGDSICEQQIQKETKATIRCLPFDFEKTALTECLLCQERSRYVALVAKAY